MKTNRPLYFTKSYTLTYEEDNLPTLYSFQGSCGVLEMIRYHEKVRNNGREAFLAGQKPRPLSAKDRTRRLKNWENQVRFIIASQDKLGRWIITEPLETRGM